jgi:two-component system nitrogen regulation sensor histidine kinase NtrY
MPSQAQAGSRRSLRIVAWANRIALSRRLAIALTLAAIASGIATYINLTGSPVEQPPDRTPFLIVLDLVLLLPLAALILFRIIRLWTARRKGSAGSRLHLRLVLLFSVLAVTPAIIVAVFSAFLFNSGVQGWLAANVGNALEESAANTERLLAEYKLILRRDISALADDINRNAMSLMRHPNQLANYVAARAQERGINQVAVFDRKGRVLVSTMIDFGVNQIERADVRAAVDLIKKDGQIAVLARSDNFRAITRLTLFYDSDVYLFVRRPIDASLTKHIANIARTVKVYERFRQQRAGFEIGFYVLYGLVGLLLLLAAVWLGLYFANQIVRPVSALIAASERIRGGDLGARVTETRSDDELASLSRSFNRMTSELERSQSELVEANRQLDARREFTETVLAGVSAGVIGLDVEGRINLPNRSASQLLSVDLDSRADERLEDVVPEFAGLIEAAGKEPERAVRREIEIKRDGRAVRLIVQIASEMLRGETVGFVVTFDDITELQQAQRTAAWADVARRIAHEIKNPLTPIQLSAERLRRKYLDQIRTDRDVFETCTDTIIRQVGDIGRLVNEFSSFARMPTPRMRNENLIDICRRAIFLQRNAHPEIVFDFDAPGDALDLVCDSQQINQAITNLLQNAVDSLTEACTPATPEDDGKSGGRIAVAISVEDNTPVVEVVDNGRGLPEDLIDRLTEPYVTTRTKGTGLGLAIVRKIMDDHGGELRLENRPEGGARIRMIFAHSQDSLHIGEQDAPNEAAE